MKKLFALTVALLIPISFAQNVSLDERVRNAENKNEVKVAEIIRTTQKKTFQRGDTQIRIHDVRAIEGGVEITAQAWIQGKQVGFGDGTVDRERFRILNPPVLVDDPTGDVVREITKKDMRGNITQTTRRLRADPEEAMLQVLEHNLTVMNLHDDSRIIAGKVGNTTTTVYPDPDAESTSVDGHVIAFTSGGGTTWDQIHDSTDGSTGGGPYDAVTNGTAFSDIVRSEWFTDNGYVINRSFFLFDTSSIPDTDDISSATFSVWGIAVTNSDNDGLDYLGIVQSSPASNTALVTGDFDQCGDIDNPTQGATGIDFGSLSTGAYNDFTLNASGRGWISKTGITKLGMREGHDIEDTAIQQVDASGNRFDGYFADQTGTTNDPKLVIEHAAAAAADPIFFNSQ